MDDFKSGVALLTVDNRFLLLEVRSLNISQGGEICLPGGRREGREELKALIKREVKEELGLDNLFIKERLADDRVLNGNKVAVLKVEIASEQLKKLCINKCEVDKILLIPFSFFIDNPVINVKEIIKKKEYYDLINRYPIIENFNDFCWLYEDYPIFGLTARIIRKNIVEAYGITAKK